MKKSLLLLLVGLSLTLSAWPAFGQSSPSASDCEQELRDTQDALDDVNAELELVYHQLADTIRQDSSYRYGEVPRLLRQEFRRGQALGRREGLPIGSGALAGAAFGARFGLVGVVVGTLAGAAGGGLIAAFFRRPPRKH